MSLKELASTMSAQGRGPDDVLVHMSSKELAGLQGLALAAGGSLTVNPKTGLPEAGFLDSLLPSILGFAANFIVPGSGMFVGAATGAMQNKENPLMGALMGGMGGYGAGSLAQGMTGLGAQGAMGAQNAAMATQAANQTANLAAAQQGLGALQSSALAGDFAAADMLTGAQQAVNEAAGSQFFSGLNAAPVNTASFMQQASPMERANYALEGGKQLGTFEPGSWDQFIGTAADKKAGTEATGLGGAMGAMKTAGMAAAPGMLYTPEMTEPEEEGEIPRYRYSAEYTGGTRLPDSAYTSERQYFTQPTFTRMAEGGEVKKDVAKGMSGQSADAMRYLMGQSPSSSAAPAGGPGTGINPGAVVNTGSFMSPQTSTTSSGTYTYDPRTQSFSKAEDTSGGTTSLADLYGYIGGHSSFKKGGSVDLKKGGFVVPADVVSALGNGSSEAGLEMLAKRYGAKPIKGKGDGQSDSIKAKIDRKQPAAVARDEAYLGPAQVKKAGGAKKLYAMMDNIRTQAHGKKEQQRPVNPRAALA
jgi:hypothetical protein